MLSTHIEFLHSSFIFCPFFLVSKMGKQTMGTPAQALKYRSDNKLYRIQVLKGLGFFRAN